MLSATTRKTRTKRDATDERAYAAPNLIMFLAENNQADYQKIEKSSDPENLRNRRLSFDFAMHMMHDAWQTARSYAATWARQRALTGRIVEARGDRSSRARHTIALSLRRT